jgi:UDP-N-acetylmuramoyl-tripeptide--D-alanyl-D-alanine ligase
MQWTDAAVRHALDLPPAAGVDARYSAITTDTRSLEPGSLFVALVGERFDGHAFLEAARAAGATGAVVRKGTPPVPGLVRYEVDDTLEAYGLLARERRRQLRGPVVAITGTNGKTSTKEMLAAVLRTRYRVHATRLNLNNLVGVPQTILEAADETEALIVEAGANQPGEIGRYRRIIEPSVAVVTNVAAGHVEGFGSLEGVLHEKLALTDGVPLAVVGTEPPILAEEARQRAGRVVTAGLEHADVEPSAVQVTPDGHARLTVDGVSFTLGLLGLHQAGNAMIVWALVRELGLDPAAAGRALETVSIPGGRGELIQRGGLTILHDGYNANPSSFRAAIAMARSLTTDRRLVFVAGTMRELGPDSARYHAEIARELVALAPDLLAAVGEFVPALEPYRVTLGNRLVLAPDVPALGAALTPLLHGTELIVLKGSRGVALERLIPQLTSTTSTPA